MYKRKKLLRKMPLKLNRKRKVNNRMKKLNNWNPKTKNQVKLKKK